MDHPSSVLGPVDPSSVGTDGPESPEREKSAPWIVRKLVGSMTGRIVMSSYESLRAAGTSIVCLSPWGDSSPLFLPCIRFRDLAVHTVVVATGGMAAVAAPVMAPVSEIALSSLGDSILVELGIHAGFDLGVKAANDLVFEKPLNHILPIHSRRLETSKVKVVMITLRYQHVVEDAAVGFFRSSVHGDVSLFTSVKDYLATEKGWFSPYLFASARRPIIPRTMKPDIIFCHGPFLLGDYRIGETLLAQSALSITFCDASESTTTSSQPSPPPTAEDTKNTRLHFPSLNLSNMFPRSRSPSPDLKLAPTSPTPPRRLVILLVGIKPHRAGIWTSSARPGESVIQYVLCDGCPAILVPAKLGAPLVAWDGLTLEQLWALSLPPASARGQGGEGGRSNDGKFEGVVGVLCEYLELCVDWGRMVVNNIGASGAVVAAAGDDSDIDSSEEGKKAMLRNAVTLLVAAAVRTQTSKEVRKEIDEDRCGIAIWRIP